MDNNKTNWYNWVITGTLIAAIAALITTNININANKDIQQERFEKEMISRALLLNDKDNTIENLKFLLKMKIISPEYEYLINNLSDEIFVNSENEYYTKDTDELGKIEFWVFDVHKKKIPERAAFGAYVQIECNDTINNFKLFLSGYCNAFGKVDFFYPSNFYDKFARVKVIKQNYYNKTFEIMLKDDVHTEIGLERKLGAGRSW